MSFLLSAFTGLKYLGRHHDDDWVDVLHYQFTSNILICLSILVSYKQFGGRPIECMLPDHLPEDWDKYAENYCWAQDTYYLPYEQDLTRQTELHDAHIGYYKWVPFYLLLTAFSFQIPGQAWRFMASTSGIQLESLIEHAIDPKNVDMESRKQATRIVAIYLENALNFQRRLYKRGMIPHKYLRLLNLPYKAFFLTISYIVAKLLYLGNVFAQFLLMNFFLESKGWYGWDTLVQVMNGTQWETSGYFPRDTLCDFQVRLPGNVQQYSIQCVLSINLFTEKLFVFLWFWYHILGIITTMSLIYWITVCLPPVFPRYFVERHLDLADMPFDPVESDVFLKKFVGHYLRTDGIFILRIVNMHTGAIFVSELMATLYKSYVGIETLVSSVRGDAGQMEQKWPSIETLQRMRSEISAPIIGVEKIHPPPTASAPLLDQPDSTRQQGRSIPKVVASAKLAPKALPEDSYPHSADENENEASGYDESPIITSAPRKRHIPLTIKTTRS